MTDQQAQSPISNWPIKVKTDSDQQKQETVQDIVDKAHDLRAEIGASIGTIFWISLDLTSGAEAPIPDAFHHDTILTILNYASAARREASRLFEADQDEEAMQTALAVSGIVDRIQHVLSLCEKAGNKFHMLEQRAARYAIESAYLIHDISAWSKREKQDD